MTAPGLGSDPYVFPAADGAGLEEMFLELTADTQRERKAA